MGYVDDIRKFIGNRPMFLVGAGTLILNQKNQLLLILRSDNNTWSIPGGSLELGETFEEAAIREAYEETNFKIEDLTLYKIFSGKELYHIYPNGDEVYNVSCIFTSRDYSGQLKSDDDESLEVKFFDLSNIPKNLNPPDKVFIKDFIGDKI